MAAPRSTLICGVNWIGDAVMSMPAIQRYRQHYPDERMVLLIKPGLRALWSLHAAPDKLLIVQEGWGGTWKTAQDIRKESIQKAYVLPHSFRSAVWPWLARVPERIGAPGHSRDWMLTRTVNGPAAHNGKHQRWEYATIFFPDEQNMDLEMPSLTIPDSLMDKARSWMPENDGPYVGLVPGAARGPSKQWPQTHFIETAQACLDAGWAQTIVVFGSPKEYVLCEDVCQAIGKRSLNLAGRTSLAEWAATLQCCRVVVANDSGGMHLATAVGATVVAVFGLTDPAVTGPIGTRARVVRGSEVGARDIPRDSEEARLALARVTPDRVIAEIQQVIESVS
jgi:heptosyltransferase II